jgi:protein-disulfide isomerase
VPEERLTKDQRRDYARELARLEREKRQKAESRNRILIRAGVTVAIVGVLGAIAGGIWLSTRPEGPGPANMLSDGILLTGSGGVVTAVENEGIPADGEPVPTDPADYADVPLHIVTYIDFGCPYCNLFETTNSAQIEELVSSGAATLEVHPIEILDDSFHEPDNLVSTRYSSRAANAAACVAAYEPSSFLDVSDAFFANQPEEGTSGLTNGEIADLVKGAGVDSDKVNACINDETYKGWVQLASKRATSDPDLANPSTGGFGTPTIFVNGERYGGALDDPSAFQQFLALVIGVDDSGDGSTPSPTPTPTPTPTTAG